MNAAASTPASPTNASGSPFPAPLAIAAFAAAAIVLGALFWEAALNLWMRWGQQQELSHSYFIPLISLWLVWINRDVVKKSVGGPSFSGVAIIAGALALLLLGQLTSIFLFQHLGLVVAIAGTIAAYGGLSLLRTLAAPVAFLFFAVPPPYWVITVLSWKFQQMSSILGVAMVELMDIPVYLSGNIIDLGEYKLQVAEACSGLRYLFPFLSLGVMSAYMYQGKLWQHAVIVLATIPITILMNSFRIAATAAMVQAYGVEHAEGALHFFEGWVVFLFCLIALFCVIAVLARFSTPRVNPLDALTTPILRAATPRMTGKSHGAIFAGAAVLALAAVGASKVVTSDALIIPDRTAFANLPQEFPGWNIDILPMDPSVAEVLGADDSIVANLRSPAGEDFNLYIAYLNAQRDGRSWHSPRQCIPGGGWKITKHDIVKTQTAAGENIAYNRLVIENGDHRQLVYYWYDQRGRRVANEFIMKFWLIVDAVTRKRSDGAMVRLLTPIGDGMTLSDGDKKLQSMIDRVEEFLPAYVPE